MPSISSWSIAVLACVALSVTAQNSFVVRRNVKDFGAIGDGVHDDTAAFIAALTTGKATTQRSGAWSNSQYYCQTTQPSIVVVPNGTYLLSAQIPLPYYSQLVGEMPEGFSSVRPTLKFVGSGYTCMDAGIDEGKGNGWYGGINQDNFYRQVRNLVVDTTGCGTCTSLHWQVSQGRVPAS
jgi:glucan 1,3-beta-glucosidase